ncbi:hypothetical protein BH09MYX1_BH09MYX1_33550 [soil metagenome]
MAGLVHAPNADAQPLRLRADAIVETRTPSGMLILQGQDRARPWLDFEALVWGGARVDAAADVLVFSMRLHDPKGRAELQAGRFVLATGAVHPVHLDGARALARTSFRSTIELFGGTPVVPHFGTVPYEWLVGGRVAQGIGPKLTVGASYVQRRAHAEVVDKEVGLDLAALPTPWLDVAGRAAYDTTSPGLSDALISIAARTKKLRFELFGTHRSASRLLPATSLFSVLGDVPSENVGFTVRWAAAPRLDLLGSVTGQEVGASYGGNAWLRATLFVDDLRDGNLGLELRRQQVSTSRWSGIRALAALPIGRKLRFSTEIELVLPDVPDGRGVVWPWGILALHFRPVPGWDMAAAIEAGASPDQRYQLNALFRLSRTLELL